VALDEGGEDREKRCWRKEGCRPEEARASQSRVAVIGGASGPVRVIGQDEMEDDDDAPSKTPRSGSSVACERSDAPPCSDAWPWPFDLPLLVPAEGPKTSSVLDRFMPRMGRAGARRWPPSGRPSSSTSSPDESDRSSRALRRLGPLDGGGVPAAEEGWRWKEAVGRPRAPPGEPDEDDGPAGEPPSPPKPKPNELTPPAPPCWLACVTGNDGDANDGPLRLSGLPNEPPPPGAEGGVPPGDDAVGA